GDPAVAGRSEGIARHRPPTQGSLTSFDAHVCIYLRAPAGGYFESTVSSTVDTPVSCGFAPGADRQSAHKGATMREHLRAATTRTRIVRGAGDSLVVKGIRWTGRHGHPRAWTCSRRALRACMTHCLVARTTSRSTGWRPRWARNWCPTCRGWR